MVLAFVATGLGACRTRSVTADAADVPPLARDEQGRFVRLQLRDVSGTGPSNAWAVGDEGRIVRWNGSIWVLQSFRAPGVIYGIATSTVDDAWLVGENGYCAHYDGSRWSRVATHTVATLRAVWSLSPTVVYAVGDEGTVLRWESTSGAFRRVDVAMRARLNHVTGLSGSDVWIVGASGTVLRFDGQRAQRVDTHIDTALNASWFASPTDGWIVGEVDETGPRVAQSAVILRWNGASLQRVASATAEPLRDVWGAGPTHVWAVGHNFGRNYDGPRRQITFFDGNAWAARSQGAGGWYAGVWGDGSGRVWAVGCCEPIIVWDNFAWVNVTRQSMLIPPPPPPPVDSRIIRRR